MSDRREGEFHFVSAQSRGRSGPLNSHALSHVAKSGWKRRKETSTGRNKAQHRSSDTKLTLLPREPDNTLQRSSTLPESRRVTQDHRSSFEKQSLGPSRYDSDVQHSGAIVEEAIDDIPEAGNDELGGLISLAHPKTFLDTALIDPFETFSTPVDRSASFLLKHCKSA